MNTLSAQRLHYLDAVRAFALLLGIVFHASLSFMPMFIGWAVMDINTADAVAVFVFVSHSFRLELFFLIAGFFASMTLTKQGAAAFLKTRLVRIAIPFVVGWVLLRPLIVAGWKMGADSMRGNVDILGALTDGYRILISTPEGLFVGTHLWFLYYLLLITLGAVVLLQFARHYPQLGTEVDRLSNKLLTKLSDTRFTSLWLAVPTSVSLWFMQHWGVDTPDKSLQPQLTVYMLYGAFFLFGWLMQRHTEVIDALCKLTALRFIVCGIAIVLSLMLSAYETNLAHPQYEWIKLLFMLSYATMMWSLVFITLGLFKRFLNRPTRAIRYVSDASYWLYLIHLPVVVFLQIGFAELELHWLLKLLSIISLTIAFSLVLYDAFVRSTMIGKVLNGRRKARGFLVLKKPSGTRVKADKKTAVN